MREGGIGVKCLGIFLLIGIFFFNFHFEYGRWDSVCFRVCISVSCVCLRIVNDLLTNSEMIDRSICNIDCGFHCACKSIEESRNM